MSEHNITVQGGSSVRLPTAGKYCDRDIVVTAEGGTGGGSGFVVCTDANPRTGTQIGTLLGLNLYLQAISIASNAFLSAECLNAVKADFATDIGDSAFTGCPNLVQVDFPKAQSIGYGCFSKCASLENVSLPNVVEVADSVFHECKKLSRIRLPKAESIGSAAFRGCTSLGEVVLPLVTLIGVRTFGECSGLNKIELPMVEGVDEGAFQRCDGLTKVDLPAATSIGVAAFSGCSNLSAIILRTTETVCVVDFSALNETPMLTGEGHLYVPSVMYEYYRAGYEAAINELMPGFFDILFRKIEDYPEICG